MVYIIPAVTGNYFKLKATPSIANSVWLNAPNFNIYCLARLQFPFVRFIVLTSKKFIVYISIYVNIGKSLKYRSMLIYTHHTFYENEYN